MDTRVPTDLEIAGLRNYWTLKTDRYFTEEL